MKNKYKLKSYIIKTLVASILIIIISIILNQYEYQKYIINYNNRLNNIISTLKEEYPNISDKEIASILNSENDKKDNILNKYGIDINKDSVIKQNDLNHNTFILIDTIFIIIAIVTLFLIFYRYNHQKEKEINDIAKYLEELNKKNYVLELDSMSEDELSILKTEIYKTAILLKESASNSEKDKQNLKKSLEDISHQLKTPLTSIFILLDNIIDNPDMDSKTKAIFLNDIKRELININFLTQSILKLSKLDSNTITFIKEENEVKDILQESISNISTICDLKNIKVNIKIDDDIKIKCDKKWQIEAITNILKNCVDHEDVNSSIDITVTDNNSYVKIIIKDYGPGIDQEDLPHIFERFYKGKNAKKDSIGIGLALSKSIIEEDNGKIYVSSNSKGTEFTIKYFKI